jgi:hypothetical protein
MFGATMSSKAFRRCECFIALRANVPAGERSNNIWSTLGKVHIHCRDMHGFHKFPPLDGEFNHEAYPLLRGEVWRAKLLQLEVVEGPQLPQVFSDSLNPR